MIQEPSSNKILSSLLFCCIKKGVSLLENATAIGLPVPEKLKDVLAQLHGKDGELK